MNINTQEESEPALESAAGIPPDTDWGQGRQIKLTASICPQCLVSLKARVLERNNEVWMDKSCKQHGRFSALLASDSRHYFEPSDHALEGKSCCGSSCGPAASPSGSMADSAAWANHSCTILIEITERCNLTCPTCFAGSSPQHSHMMSLDEFSQQVDQLVVGGKSGSDMIQLSGGEPTIHPQFNEMVELLFDRGFRKVCINSNGIKLAQAGFTGKLARCTNDYPEAELFVYLQFDGFEESTHQALRGRKDLLETKRKALELCEANNISVHPVMTLTRGINDHEVGDFVQMAVDIPELKNVVIQPAMYSGRYDNPRLQKRLTLADTVKLICEQSGTFSPDDFMPIPCSDPNCFGMAVAFRTANGLLPISRYFPRYEDWGSDQAKDLIDAFTDTINGPDAIGEAIRWATANGHIGEALESLDDDQVNELLDALIEAQADTKGVWDKLLTISIKPFMDAWTYDQDRIDQCCVHILDRQGNPVSFCEFNAINRPKMMTNTDGLAQIKVINA
ncbi:MAG: radical SAM protein [Lysobacterales bacterium]